MSQGGLLECKDPTCLLGVGLGSLGRRSRVGRIGFWGCILRGRGILLRGLRLGIRGGLIGLLSLGSGGGGSLLL